MKKAFLILAMILVTRPLLAEKKPKADAPKKPVLTQEEKEIVQNREMLENLDLLRDFEKFRFYDLFAGEAKPEKPAPKKDEKKE